MTENCFVYGEVSIAIFSKRPHSLISYMSMYVFREMIRNLNLITAKNSTEYKIIYITMCHVQSSPFITDQILCCVQNLLWFCKYFHWDTPKMIFNVYFSIKVTGKVGNSFSIFQSDAFGTTNNDLDADLKDCLLFT